MKPVLAITVGDPNGIGPEVVLKAISRTAVRRRCTPVLVGPSGVFLWYARRLGLERLFSSGGIFIAATGADEVFAPRPGRETRGAGRVAAAALQEAAALCLRGHAAAMVTAPVSKRALHSAGVRSPGQTEMIRDLAGSSKAWMMLASQVMRVGLCTIHEPLRRVPGLISVDRIVETARAFHSALVRDWNIGRPRIAVLGLNPHASEGGDIGHEDGGVVAPAVRKLRRQGILAYGPFPADGFFGRYRTGEWDLILAMYHDQGLIPLKLSSMGEAVNVTVGLPLVRTSPDHGTAFDLAGTGTASEGSMVRAIMVALDIAAARSASPGGNP